MSNAIFSTFESHQNLTAIDSPYRRYSCQEGNPLACHVFRTTSESSQQARSCPICAFPAPLAEKAEIQGELGLYRIDAWMGARGMGRLYSATLLGLNQSVVIKEYLLPPLHFNAEEVRQRQQAFTQVAGIDLADGRVQDFRLLRILEAIADLREPRCYLVLEFGSTNATLVSALLQGAFSGNQVYRVLQQVLQSLKFLHGQNFRLPSGLTVEGLAHGNLNLDNLLISVKQAAPESFYANPVQTLAQEGDFFVYLCDLNLWEGLFLPPLVQQTPASKTDDLEALGWVAFNLLAADIAKETGVQLDPRKDRHWPPVEQPLKHFILRLLRLEQPFESADEALQHLYQLPLPAQFILLKPLEAPLEPVRTKRMRLRLAVLLCGILLLALLGWLVSVLFSHFFPKSLSLPKTPLCCLKDVSGILPGTFTYAATENGTWRYVLQQKNLVRQGVSLEQQLKISQPQLTLNLDPTVSIDQAIANVRSGSAAFAIAPLLQPLPQDLESQVVAYDGVAIAVAFSYTKRERSLPILLDGRMSIEQLAQVYTNQPEDWKAFSGNNLPLQRYSPQNEEVLEVVKSRVVSKGLSANLLPEFEMMRTIIRDFELRNVGSIGFASFSKVVGQCSVYPLALEQKGKAPVQALQFNSGKTISPATDLCSKKGSYALNPQVFQQGRYPLSYSIAVIYPRDNDRPQIGIKMAEMLKTTEGQHLLAETGLVPLPQ